MKKRIRKLEVTVLILVVLNIGLMFMSFTNDSKQKFKEIDVERINITEPGKKTPKMVISNASRFPGQGVRSGGGGYSGMLFVNEDGYETGGLIFDGRKMKGGQKSNSGLTFDGYRQDQSIVLQHKEVKDSLTSYYEDGISIISRPDFKDKNEEYTFYKQKKDGEFSKKVLDSLSLVLAHQNKIKNNRLYLGSKRGNKGKGWFDETGLYIKNKYGKDMIRIYVDVDNVPRFEVLDSLGKAIKYNLIPLNQ